MVDPVCILDGGMGKELERIGAPFRQPEWSALALMESPDHVLRAHRNFVEAGADVIITNTYGVVPFHIGDDRFAMQAPSLARLAGELARTAADEADREILVAGSLPPLFGSYEPESFDPDRAAELYPVLVDALGPFVDLWLAETMSSVGEYTAVADVASGKPLWAAFCLDDQLVEGRAHLWSGESVTQAVAAASGDVEAVLFNCSRPEVIGPALAEVLTAFGGEPPHGVRIGGYANAFVPKPQGYAANDVVLDHRPDLTPATYADFVGQWIEQGATIVGGCCGIFPDHIAELATRLKPTGV